MTTTNLQTPWSVQSHWWREDDLPIIDSEEPFSDVVLKLWSYIAKAVDTPFTYEQLRTTIAGQSLKPLISSLEADCHHPAVVAALLAARYLFVNSEGDADAGLNDSRALACELVAWQFITFLSEKELIDHLLYELPQFPDVINTGSSTAVSGINTPTPSDRGNGDVISEASPLLRSRSAEHGSILRPPRRAVVDHQTHFTNGATSTTFSGNDDDDKSRRNNLDESMAGMNALEIAAVCDAKKFLSQTPTQKIVSDMWNGDIIFWENLSVQAVKKPRVYNKRVADPFTRLRVPKYQKAFQVLFFLGFLALYYAVLVERNPRHSTATELVLYLFIAAFAVDELGEIKDAGIMFYQTDFWSLWDIAIIIVSVAFFITRIVGLVKNSDYIIDVSFDILSMTALFLVPRIFSVMSLNPYFGSLIPVLKEMTKAFCKFLPVIVVLYLGFLTTFSMLARDRMTLNEMSWLLIKVFFGSSYLGFDMAVNISPLFGYTLMLIFVCLTNILLITSLVSLVSNSLTEVMAHAREEYLFQYSIYVLESSTSRRLTYFMPPLNLFPLIVLRPLRLLLPSEDVRRIRIFVLKATHLPFVAFIWAYESLMTTIAHAHPTLSKAPHPTDEFLNASHFNLDGARDFPRSPTRKRALNDTSATIAADTTTSTTKSALRTADNTELLALVQKLSTQVDGLTAMVAGQQKD